MSQKKKFAHRLNVRFTDKQWQEIEKISAKKALDKAEIVRKAIQLNYQKIPTPPQPKFDEHTTKQIYLLLNNLTNNTNQIAHQANLDNQLELNSVTNLIKAVTELCQKLS